MKSKNFIHFKPKKYKNVTCFVDGIRFDSRREADYYGQLKLEKKAGLIKNFERQVNIPLVVNGITICHHRVDFIVELENGKLEVREVKGFATDVWQLKRKIFEATKPEIEYKVIK